MTKKERETKISSKKKIVCVYNQAKKSKHMTLEKIILKEKINIMH
jgi:hypothetical protein